MHYTNMESEPSILPVGDERFWRWTQIRILTARLGQILMHSRLIDLFRRTTSTGKYYPEIDGLRFIAIALVVLYHLSDRSLRSFRIEGGQDEFAVMVRSIFDMGDVGVHLFFAISGYIISKPFLDRYALHLPQPFSIGQYYLRRLTRLEPPYIVVMTGIFLFLTVTGYQTSIAKSFNETSFPLWQSYLASLPYLHGFIFGSDSRLNPPAWSLELEVRFYILAPLLMTAYFSFRRSGAARGLLLLGLVACILTQQLLFDEEFQDNNYSLFSYIQYFVIGILLCDLHLRAERAQPSKPAAIGIDILGLCALVVFARSHQWIDQYSMREFVKLVSVYVIFNGAFYGHYFAMFLRNGFISAVGGMCYSIYLIHMPMMQVLVEKLGHLLNVDSFAAFLLIQGAVILPVILASSAAFFLLIEKPCMQKDWPKRLMTNVQRLSATARKRGAEPKPNSTTAE